MPSLGPRYTEAEAREAIQRSRSYSEALRRLGMRAAGGNHRTLRMYAEEVWRIPTEHFDPAAARITAFRRPAAPLAEVLVEQSTYSRGTLKQRLYREGLKHPVCEICGQGEIWHGRPMSLILDHVNGIADDNRLENLQIVCPNCAATLETHCGRNSRRSSQRQCDRCGRSFFPRSGRHRFCSRECGQRAGPRPGPRPNRRKVARPPYSHLIREIAALGYCGVGRRYGVTDNAVRKWVRQYEREREAAIPVQGSLPSEGEAAA